MCMKVLAEKDARTLCVALLLLLTIVLSVVAGLQQEVRPSLLFLVASAVFGAVLAGVQIGQERITTAGLHLFAVWLMLGFAPLLDYRSGLFDQHYASYHFFPFLPTGEELALASVAVVFWLLSFKIGYRTRIESAVLWIKNHNPGMGFFAVQAQCIVGVAALAYIYEQVGFGVLTRRGFESFEYDTPGEFTFFTSTIRSVPLVALLALTLMLRDGKLLGAKKIIAVVLGAGLLVGNVLINNPVAAARFFTGTVLLAFAYVLFFHRSRNGASFLILVLVGVLLVFPMVDIGRVAVDVDSIVDALPGFMDGLFAGDPYRTFEAIPAALRYLEQYGSTYGFQLLGPLLFWVPRSFWPEKPEGSGWLLSGAFGGFHDNVSCPTPCEALLNFGWIGIPIIAVAFAITLRILDDVNRSPPARDDTDSIRVIDVLYPLFLGQVFFITRGDFLSPWAFTVGMIIATIPMVLAEFLRRLLSLLILGGTRRASNP